MASAKRFRGGFWDWVRHPWSRFKAEADEDELRRQLTPVGEPTPEELTYLVGLLNDDETKYVARDILGEIGEPAVPYIIEALRNSNEEIVEAALRGVRSCLSDGNGGSNGFRNAMLEELISLLRSRRIEAKYITESLLRLGEDRAIKLLTSDEYISLENTELHELLEVLADFNVDVPADKILGFAETLRQDHEEYPRPHQFGACITVLADKGHKNARTLAEEAIQSPNKTVRRYAREALELLEGVKDVWESAFNQVHDRGLANVRHPLQVYYCIQVLDSEVRNGGFSQYFANPSGDDAAMAVKSLEEIGADSTAEIVGHALAVFGPDGPSGDRDTRAYQISRLKDADFETLEALNREYYTATDQPLELLSRFVIQHKQHFL